MYEKCSKLIIKIPQQRHRHRSGSLTVSFKEISPIDLVFLLLTMTSSDNIQIKI